MICGVKNCGTTDEPKIREGRKANLPDNWAVIQTMPDGRITRTATLCARHARAVDDLLDAR